MLVSFYAQISIIGMSLLVILVPFLGFPQSWDNSLTAVFGVLIFGVGLYSFYVGYVRILKREERRLRDKEAKNKEIAERKATKKAKAENKTEEEPRSKDVERHTTTILDVIHD
jgi:hypothetical protein